MMLFLVKKCQLCDGEAIHEILKKKHKLARTWEQNEQQMIFGENMKTMIISQHCQIMYLRERQVFLSFDF